MCGCTWLAHIIYQRQLYSSIIVRARHTYILWVKEELASRIESASFAHSHLGYLLFIVFFFPLSLFSLEREKNRERERCRDIGCSIRWYSSMIGRYLLLYVDEVANFSFFFSSPAVYHLLALLRQSFPVMRKTKCS